MDIRDAVAVVEAMAVDFERTAAWQADTLHPDDDPDDEYGPCEKEARRRERNIAHHFDLLASSKKSTRKAEALRAVLCALLSAHRDFPDTSKIYSGVGTMTRNEKCHEIAAEVNDHAKWLDWPKEDRCQSTIQPLPIGTADATVPAAWRLTLDDGSHNFVESEQDAITLGLHYGAIVEPLFAASVSLASVKTG